MTLSRTPFVSLLMARSRRLLLRSRARSSVSSLAHLPAQRRQREYSEFPNSIHAGVHQEPDNLTSYSEVTFDELGGLNQLDAYFFCYRFASSGLVDVSKAVIGSCIVRSAASMVDDNAYRVVLTNSATLSDASREEVSGYMVEVAQSQKQALNAEGKAVPAELALLESRAKLAQLIGRGVATSP